MISTRNSIADLVMAMLAVNQWRLDQSGAIYEGLLEEGLFDPARILGMKHGQLKSALKRAGYKKADFVVDLLCDRLFDMANKLSKGGEETFKELLRSKDNQGTKKFLMAIKGVGPKVYENFCFLHKSSEVSE